MTKSFSLIRRIAMSASFFALNRFHLLVILTWQFMIMFATQMLFGWHFAPFVQFANSNCNVRHFRHFHAEMALCR